jgi:hypothetical protein
VVGEGDQRQFDVFELDRRIQFELGRVGDELLLPPLLLVLAFNKLGVFLLAVELLA